MKYIIRYDKKEGITRKDYYLAIDGHGVYADDDWFGAERFDTRERAEEVLRENPRLGGDDREPGVIEEVT